MEATSNLSTFAKILTDKGYDGYFHTQAAYPGKLKESISEYLENCRKGTGGPPKQELLLTGYLKWEGEDKPRVQCSMRVKCQNGKFDLKAMTISRKNRFGHLLKQSELTNLTTIAAPTAKDAIALVSDTPKQKDVARPRHFRL